MEKRKWTLNGRWNPCKDCERRRVGCHAECEDYKKYAENNQETYRKRKEHREIIDAIADSRDRARRQRNSNPKVFKMTRK